MVDEIGCNHERLTEAGLAPVLSNVRQIVADNWPDIIDRVTGISIILEG
jgi:hypothetical protein